MFLSRFGVKNYKCLGDIDIPLTPIHVLIGQNDAGKTSLLEALAAFHGSGERPLAEVFPEPWEGADLVRHGSPTFDVDFAGTWTPLPHESASWETKYGLAVTFTLLGRDPVTAAERVEARGDREDLEGGGKSTVLNRFRHGEFSGGRKPRLMGHAFVDRVRPVQLCRLNAKIMAMPAALDPNRKFRLHHDGFGLATMLADIFNYDRQGRERIENDFCKYFPQFSGLSLEQERALHKEELPDGTFNTSHANGIGIHFKTRRGHHVRAQQASDGAILFLAFLALARVPDPPPLLLIEEPENGVYPERLKELAALLKGVAASNDGPKIPQIIMTTHSPYLLSSFKPEEVTFLSRPPGDPDAPVRARPLRDAPRIAERLAGGEFYLGELWYNLSEEELFGEP